MNDLRKFLLYILGSKLVILGFLIYFLFNISALKTNWFDFFFFGSSLHYCCQGLDFYGIPNGVYSFIHGGNLSGGNLPEGINPYSGNIVSNFNNYHPLLSLPLGTFLILFNPSESFYLWMLVKMTITLFAAYYIYRNFKGNKFLNLGIFLFLTNFSQYSEIRISQYQFIFNILALFFLINLVKNKNSFEKGILFFLTLVAKPISLLWIPILIIKKEFALAITGVSLFLISTITFNALGIGQHYLDNLIYHFLHPKRPDSIDFMTLNALLTNAFNFSQKNVNFLKYSFLIGIYLVAIFKKIHLLSIIFLLTTYFLFFYEDLLEYHWSVLGPVLAICLLAVPEFQTKIARLSMIIISLPTVFFILRIFNFEFIMDPVYGPNPTIKGWQIVLFFQLLPLTILSVIIFMKEISIFKFEILKYLRK